MDGSTQQMSPRRNVRYIKRIQLPGGKYRYFYNKEELDAYNKEGNSNSKEAMISRYRERQRRLLEKSKGNEATTNDEKAKEEQAKAYNDVAERVIKGEFGNGEDRYKKLEAAGYDWKRVQNIVNEKLGSSVRLKVDEKTTKESEASKKPKESKKAIKTSKLKNTQSSEPKTDSKSISKKEAATKVGVAAKTDDVKKKKRKKKTRRSPVERRYKGEAWINKFMEERR